MNATGDVSGFAPPGDIHRVRSASDHIGDLVHIYGTDVSGLGSSVLHRVGYGSSTDGSPKRGKISGVTKAMPSLMHGPSSVKTSIAEGE